ncbi:unnamed protein product [Lactuca saligna]|uniref:Uncharacterized protein n=1 Tax=Lactuca saligna TaxID=75948 RepID=A0AA35ZEK8_LACSI|nr:unnamed protein product [Lactuca saligna]
MATKPLTTAAIAMTEKKMDMSLDDIIKMSKTGSSTNKTKKQRIPNKNHKLTNNNVQDKSMKLHHYMDTRSSLRQGVLSQRRSSFQGNQFPLAVDAARKAPIRSRNFIMRNQPMTSYKPRVTSVQNRGVANQKQVNKLSNQKQKQRPQTLDSLFANMKEQRMKVLSQNNNTNTRRRTGGGVQRPTPPWTRSYNY